MNTEKYEEIIKILTEENFDPDVLALAYNCFYDFKSRNIKFDTDEIITLISSQEFKDDTGMLILQALEDVFDEIQERLNYKEVKDDV